MTRLPPASQPLMINGSIGESGGQILRTSLSMSMMLGRALRLTQIRANRPKPGLAAQHLTAVRAAGELCHAEIEGGDLGSQMITFTPVSAVAGGAYHLIRSGWYPVGKGEIRCEIEPIGARRLRPIRCKRRGRLLRVSGCALVARLPGSIVHRMAREACNLLRADLSGNVNVLIEERITEAASPGATLFLQAEYENCRGGFSALGARGRPAEDVAAEAAKALLGHYKTEAAIDRHLADQLLLPAILAEDESAYSVESITSHLLTNAHILQKFDLDEIKIDGNQGQPGIVIVRPRSR